MDQMAEMGVAAHWAYKEQGEQPGTTAQVRAQRWMQSLLNCNKVQVALLNLSKREIRPFPDEIYVFTPEGRIVELPTGATPVDCLRSSY